MSPSGQDNDHGTTCERLATAALRLKPDTRHLSSDLIAGLTFAVVSVPQAMAHALLCNSTEGE